MDINASIIDQQLTGLLDKHADWMPTGDDNKKRSAAFVLLCMANCLDISQEDAVELLTEGGNDAGVDGLHIDEVDDGEFLVGFESVFFMIKPELFKTPTAGRRSARNGTARPSRTRAT